MALAPGTRLGPYEVLAPLGAGGMGEVYRARDTRLHREVAVKVLPAAVADDPHALSRFEREARALAALSHPAILALFDIGREAGLAYAVTELLEGETLRAALRRGPLPWREALDAAVAAADGLEAAHERGIVHRDLKPENVFRCSDGRVKVLDFGLAKAEPVAPEDPTASLPTFETSPGSVVGTVGYMAPEQLRGLGVDHRADVFSLGCVLHELLTGRRAFPGRTSSEVIAAVLHDEPALTGYPAAAPGSVREIVARCLRKEPAERFASARDVGHSLRAILSGSTPALPEPRRVPSGRRRGLPALAAAAVAGLAAFVLLRGHPGIPEVQPRQLTGGAGCESEPAVAPDGESVAFVAEEGGRFELRVVDASGGRPLSLTEEPGRVSSPAWLPDGKSVLFALETGTGRSIRKVPRFGGPTRVLLENARDPDVSPDGLLVAFSRPDENGFARIHVAPIAAPESARVLSRPEDGAFEHRQPRFSPDGRTICYRDFHDLWLLPAGGGPARRLTHDDVTDLDPRFSPDGAHVYFTSYRASTRAVWRVDAKGGTPERVTLGTGMEAGPSLSRDGRRLAYATASEGNALVLVDRATGARTRLEESRLFLTAALDPGGRFVVYSSSRENAADLWVQPLAGGRPSGPPTRLTEMPGVASCPSVSPDGRWVAFHFAGARDREVYVLPAKGGEPVAVAPSAAEDFLPSWSPDGRSLLFVSARGGREEAWSVGLREGRPEGAPRVLLPGPACVSPFPRFLPDGRSLVVTCGETTRADVWIVPPDGAPPRRLTADGISWWAVPDPASGELLVLSRAATGLRTVLAISTADGTRRPVGWGEPDGLAAEVSSFDVTADGRLAVLIEETRRGDVWLLEAARGGRF